MLEPLGGESAGWQDPGREKGWQGWSSSKGKGGHRGTALVTRGLGWPAGTGPVGGQEHRHPQLGNRDSLLLTSSQERRPPPTTFTHSFV